MGFWTVGEIQEEPTTPARQRRESTRDVPGSRVLPEARTEGEPVGETGKGSRSWPGRTLNTRLGLGFIHGRTLCAQNVQASEGRIQ